MRIFKNKIIVVLAVLLFVCTGVLAGVPELADVLLSAHVTGQPIPVLSALRGELSVDEAYAVQKEYVTRRIPQEGIAGFKAGLTAEGLQKKFNVNGPVGGVLYASGRYSGFPVISRNAFHVAMIETEIGFIVGKAITHRLETVDELMDKIAAVMPAIELPDLGFANLQALKGTDLVAANVSSCQFIVGDVQNKDAFDLNAIAVTLTHNGTIINQGKGAEVLGDQRQAALWLVNTMVGQGYAIQPGHVLLTGAMGQMLPGKPGFYTADYGPFGKIEFEIR